MKKLIFIAAIACAALASCVKNEVNVIDGAPQEISYQTVVNPATKANVVFDTGYKFYSWAYLLVGGETWPANQGNAKLYVGPDASNGALVEYNEAWKSTQKYYWPKDSQSSLTFFAWSDGTAAPATTGTLACDNIKGITVTDYDAATDRNKDFMVADVASNLNKAGSVTLDDAASTVINGVPTVFRHQLSKVGFKVNTKEDYSATHEITLKSLRFIDVLTKNSYEQCEATTGTKKGWVAEPTDAADLPVYAAGTQVIGQTEEAVVTDAAAGYELFMPQTFTTAGQKLEIVYDIAQKTPAVTETVTHVVDLKDASDKLLFGVEKWEAGKNYVLTITIALTEIEWAPAIVDWEEVPGATEI